MMTASGLHPILLSFAEDIVFTELCTDQKGLGTNNKIEANATSRKYTDDECLLFLLEDNEGDCPDEDGEQVNNQLPPTATKEGDDQLDELASEDEENISTAITINILPIAPEPKLKLIIDPSITAPMTLPMPTWKIIYESPALHEPDPQLPAPGASDAIQDTTEVQD